MYNIVINTSNKINNNNNENVYVIQCKQTKI
jgi:hypothetical protein